MKTHQWFDIQRYSIKYIFWKSSAINSFIICYFLWVWILTLRIHTRQCHTILTLTRSTCTHLQTIKMFLFIFYSDLFENLNVISASFCKEFKKKKNVTFIEFTCKTELNFWFPTLWTDLQPFRISPIRWKQVLNSKQK